MNNENKAILKAKIENEKSNLLKKVEEFYEGFYALFYLILKYSFNNFWWECISLSIQYTQLLVFIIDDTVSKNFL